MAGYFSPNEGEVFDFDVVEAGIDVYIENETLTAVPIDTFVSPVTAQLTGFLMKNFDYVGGQIIYTGTEPIKVIMISNTSVTLPGSGFTGGVVFTNGKNDTPCPIGEMPSGISLGTSTVIPTVCIFDLEQGNTLDLFIAQTTESPTSDIVINKGRYTVLKIGSAG